MTVIPLSTMDHVFSNDAVAPMQVVLQYGGELDLSRLKESFAETAREFTGVHAVLSRIDDHTLGLDLSREAAQISIDTAGPDVPLWECVQPASTEVGSPVARLHVTRLGARGTALALSLSHSVADGYGYFLFLAAFAARCRGQHLFSPDCNREALATAPAEGPVSTAPGKLKHSGFMLVGADVRRALRVEERRIAVSELQEGRRGDPRGSYSTSDYLGALLWKEAMADEAFAETTFTCAVDLRKYRPSAGPLFFGNASFLAAKTVPAEALRSAPADEVARWIRAAIEEVPAHIDAGLAELEALRRQAGLAVFTRLRSVRPDGGFVFSNLAKIPLAQLDFGAGPPIDLARTRRPAPHERSCAVFAADGALRLLISRP